MPFTHLHLHTEFSFLDGHGKVSKLIERVKKLNQKAVAITDHGVTNGYPTFYKEAKKAGIIPIFGVEAYMCNNMKIKGIDEEMKLRITRGKKGKEANNIVKEYSIKCELNKRAHIVILAKNQKGLEEIYYAISDANEYGFYSKPRLDFNRIEKMKNVVISTACTGGIIGYYINRDEINKAEEEILKYKEVFGEDFYVELMAIDWDVQAKHNFILANFIIKHKLKFIITNDCHYINPQDWEAHDCLLAIQSSHKNKPILLSDPNRMRYSMHDLYVKSEQEMKLSFLKRNPKLSKFVDIGLKRTHEVASKCAFGELVKGFKIMPNIKIDHVNNITDCKAWQNNLDQKEYDYIVWLCKEGWKKKLVKVLKKYPEKKQIYLDRLKEELQQIRKQGFLKYFIVVYRLMKFCEDNGIMRGPARGSSAGSLVCYLLDITRVDPIKWDLLFSRFIDPNRTDNPDIDMDFQDDRRIEVIDYFVKEYGAHNVASLSNNMLFKGKSALWDVSRLFGIPRHEVKTITELILHRSGADSRLSFTLEDSFNEFDKCKEFKTKYPKVVLFAADLEGQLKSYGTHAAGVIIADNDIRKYASLRYEKSKGRRNTLINIDKRDCDDLGLLKLDILGLNTLTIMGEAIKLIKERHDIDINIDDLEFDDPKVLKEFALGNCVGSFQFDTYGLIRLSQNIQIANFDEIMAATSLHRPGPLHGGQAAAYPAKKMGKKKAIAEHPIIWELTKDSYGEILYQEQIMMIVRELGGFDWKDTNDIRKCMSKSGGAEYFYTNYWEKFKDGCARFKIDEKMADKIFKRIMTFGSWSFNKCISHDTNILNAIRNHKTKKYITVKELFENNGHATSRWIEQPRCYTKMNSLSVDNGRLKINKIKDVYYQGKLPVWRITVESGKFIEITKEHRLFEFYKKDIQCKDIEIGMLLAMDGGYEKTEYKKNNEGHGWTKYYKKHKTIDTQKPFKDFRTREIEKFKIKMFNKPCQNCGIKYNKNKRFEVHHITHNAPNSILTWVCNSCHKKLEYNQGRNKWGSKGHKIVYEKVISKKYIGLKDCYDIEMKDSSRPTFIANGFISHNSHACSYGAISYQTMWLKKYYPIEYLTAYLNKTTDEDSIPRIINEIKRLKIPLDEPDINGSGVGFKIVNDQIYAGLTNIKGVGQKAIEEIINNQPYTDIVDFLQKNQARKVNSASVKALIKAGCFKKYYNTKALLENIDELNEDVRKKKGKHIGEIISRIKSYTTKYSDQKVLQLKSEVSPVSVGKHLVEYYRLSIENKIGKHINIMKLINIPTNVSEEETMGLDKIVNVYVLGIISKIDLKRISEEVKYVVSAENEFRYAICNIQDETDYCMLSFNLHYYKKFEKDLWSKFKDKVCLIKGNIQWGRKKIYVREVWLADELLQIESTRDKYIQYLFKNPFERYKADWDKIKSKFNIKSYSDIMNNSNKYDDIKIIGIFVYKAETIIRKADSNYKGQAMVQYEFDDGKNIYNVHLNPWYENYNSLRKRADKLLEDRTPCMLNLSFNGLSGGGGYYVPSLSFSKKFAINQSIQTPFVLRKS